MWNNLLKLSVVSFLWRRYKKTIILLPILLLFFWVVGLAHSDYLAYAKLQENNQWIGLSFVVKWLALAIGCAVFVFAHLGDKKEIEEPAEIDPDIVKKAPKATKEALFSQDINDSFARIREKKTLNSKADVILKSKKTP